MRLFLLYLTLFFTATGYSQSLTGIWRGYFVQSIFHLRSGQFVEERYKYELQLNNLPNDAVEGVTYSYKNTLFYGKAASQGIYTRKSKLLLLKESKMLELKISDQSVACLMTCYLDYSKSKTENKETLTGTYSSVNEKDGSICGNGTVYLEKVTTTEFEKEDFLLKKEASLAKRKKNPITKKVAPILPNVKADALQALVKPGAEDFMVDKVKVKTNKTDSDTTQTAVTNSTNPPKESQSVKGPVDSKTTNNSNVPKGSKPSIDSIAKKESVSKIVQPNKSIKKGDTVSKNKIEPNKSANNLAVNKNIEKKEVNISNSSPERTRFNTDTIVPKETIIPKEKVHVPDVLIKRRNVIASTFIVDSQDVSIEFYDNGQIDGDTISVYHDNKMIVSSKRLTYSPIRMNVHIEKNSPVYEFIVVAENLGEVPPNTALVIISSGSKHYELDIASDEERNAKIVLTYQKPPEKK